MSEHTYGLFRNAINKRLISELERQKAALVLFPEMEVSPPAPAPAVRLAEFDWVIFPDLHSVDFFLGQIGERFELDELRVCAFGEAVADKLRFSQLHADVIPSGLDDETVFAAISAYDPPEGANFLIPKEKHASLTLTSILRESGAVAAELAVYEILEPPENTSFRRRGR
jgi:uroporphyrinogen-III synthase